MRIFVVGNGGTSIDTNGSGISDQHTYKFLTDLVGSGLEISFIQPKEPISNNGHLKILNLPKSIKCFVVDKKTIFSLCNTLLSGLFQIFFSDFVYLFYPGKFPRIIACYCKVIRKPYGLYLRGEKFSLKGKDVGVFKRAKFINSVSSSLVKPVSHLCDQITTIRPMLNINADDAFKRDFKTRNSQPWRLLFVGRLENAKGVPELIKAAHILKSRGFPFSLSLVGDGPLYEKLLDKYGNSPNGMIRILGPIREKSLLMGQFEAADFFVLPTHHEGFPRVLYEAMIKSMVIFTTFVGGIPGLMIDRSNCIEISVGTSDSIADSIEKTSRNISLMQRLSENGLKTTIISLGAYPTHFEAVRGQLNV